MLTSEQAVMLAMALCVAGALVAPFLAGRRALAGWLTFGVTMGAAGLVVGASVPVLANGPGQAAQFLQMPRVGFALRIHVDGLTSVFLLLTAVVSVSASLYAIRYLGHYADQNVGRYHSLFQLFLAAMYGLVSTTDMMWFFFIFWQLMTLPGYALIRFEKDRPEHVRAANKYLLMMQIACAATMVGAEILAVTGATAPGGSLKYDFDTVRANLPVLLRDHAGATSAAFALFLVGFGIKMGMWPFGQVWLPDAHPAAPSPVSAMLSGVMIKTGVYGLLRYFLWLVPEEASAHFPLARWGVVITALGTVTLFTGTMQALQQEQSKRLLAFSSIGQIGYILLGTGACMCLLPTGDARLAGLGLLALLGALFHVVNHGLFKALLFLNAGSLLHATGTQDLNRMGGLARPMPVTAITAAIASAAIAGVPLLNGFASKWSIYVGTLGAGRAAWFLPVAAVVAILTNALTLALLVKFFGAGFLSRPSALVRERTGLRGRLEVPWPMQVPQVFLALLCVGLGIVPGIAFVWLGLALRASRHGFGVSLAEALPVLQADAAGISGTGESPTGFVFRPLVILGVLGFLVGLGALISRAGGASRRADTPWLCGYAGDDDCHRYGARQFYGEMKRWFGWLGAVPPPHSKGRSDTQPNTS